MTTILLSAGDASGDMHAADFVAAFRALRPDARFLGLGGRAMQAAGVELVADQRALAVGGFQELLGSARRIVSTWRQLDAALARERPDLAVLVDSGGFNIPLAKRIRRRSSTPILYYVAPQVWAWRRGRIRKLVRRVDRMAVIFPFEPEVYARSGLPVDFVGHPLVDRLAEVAARLDRDGARRVLGLQADHSLVAILPGSRRNEVVHQLPIQLEVARRLHVRDGKLGFALGVAPSIAPEDVAALVRRAALPEALRVDLVHGRTPELIRAADVVLAKPGTVTLEVALLERPLVVVGRTSPVTAAILRRAVRVPSLTMPNLIAGEALVPEFLQEDARPQQIADAVESLLSGPARTRQLEGLAAVRARLGGGGAARRTARIAEAMLDLAAA